MEITTTFYAPTRGAWRKWLEKHHAKAKEIWLVFDKKEHNEKRLTYHEALDEALCFGWIDGQAKGVDHRQYAQRFTPRRSKSQWSVVNMKRYKALMRASLVSPHGEQVHAARHRVYDPRAESAIYQIRAEFEKLADPKKAAILSRFFKTGKGEYAQGDRFFGVTVPQTRVIAKKYADRVSLSRIKYILQTGKHEERLCVLFMLVAKSKTDSSIPDFYLANTAHINNWDLVDSSAPYILGPYFFDHPTKRTMLFKLAKSRNLWERRIAIVATQYFIRQGRFDETLKLAILLIKDPHDLIHKATGWMLREVGKKDERALTAFLDEHVSHMPRTMLRYALERLSPTQRRRYMAMQ
ncbi:MAG: DNA alkylation repair protein [Patescibacteria group bacterium]